MNIFKVSVIIPVYNAEKYLRRSVESALAQEEVGEVLVVEDSSPDNSLAICNVLVAEDSRVKLLRHPNGENRGAGASRNLGLNNVSFDYVAFLDADDFFLPNRFAAAKEIFRERSEVSGVYEAVGTEFEDKVVQEKYFELKKMNGDSAEDIISFVKKPLEGKDFFESLILGHNGYPCTDGILVKTELIKVTGFFNEELKLHQDSEYWIRLAYNGYFVPGKKNNLIAIRTVHPQNRITSRSYSSKLKFTQSLISWAKENKVEKSLIKKLSYDAQLLTLRQYFKAEHKAITLLAKIIFLINK